MQTAEQAIDGLDIDFYFYSDYDLAGNRRELFTRWNVGFTLDDTTNEYQYDALGRLTSLTQTEPTVPNFAAADKRVDLAYDLAGQLDWVKRYSDAAGGSGNDVAVTDYTWDYAGRLDEIKHNEGSSPGSGTLLAGYGYTWNQRNELTAIDFLPDGTGGIPDYSAEDATYTYDPRGQLLDADYSGTSNDEDYEYDDNGNRTDVTNETGTAEYTTGDDNRLEDDGTYTYDYDAEGNRTRRYIDDDESGTFNTGDDDITEYAWDHRNRLVTVTNYATYGGNSTQQVNYTYDAFNQLIKRVVDPDGVTGSDPIEQTFYLWENGQIVLQFDKTGTGNADYSNLSHRYLWGPGVDQLLVDEVINDWQDSEDSDLLWALTDHLGTIRDWIDDLAALLDHAEYDGAGRRLDTPAIDAAFGFHGLLHDKSTGNNYNRNRWSDPDTGGFLSEDPIKSGTNWRAAYGNAAVMYVDADGLHFKEPRSKFGQAVDEADQFVGLVEDRFGRISPEAYGDLLKWYIDRKFGKDPPIPQSFKACLKPSKRAPARYDGPVWQASAPLELSDRQKRLIDAAETYLELGYDYRWGRLRREQRHDLREAGNAFLNHPRADRYIDPIKFAKSFPTDRDFLRFIDQTKQLIECRPELLVEDRITFNDLMRGFAAIGGARLPQAQNQPVDRGGYQPPPIQYLPPGSR